jgi:hypothetical protein
VWQTAQAAEKWPVSEGKAVAIREAFASPLRRRGSSGSSIRSSSSSSSSGASGGGEGEKKRSRREESNVADTELKIAPKKVKAPEWKVRVEKNRDLKKEAKAQQKAKLNAMRQQRKLDLTAASSAKSARAPR